MEYLPGTKVRGTSQARASLQVRCRAAPCKRHPTPLPRPALQVSNRQELTAAGIDANLIARRATESYLQQILIHGFFRESTSAQAGIWRPAHRMSQQPACFRLLGTPCTAPALLLSLADADPHPGNISVDTRGNLMVRGALPALRLPMPPGPCALPNMLARACTRAQLYDFGMMGEIVPDVRERLMDLFVGGWTRSLVMYGALKQGCRCARQDTC